MDIEYIPRDLVSVYVGVKKYIVEVIGTENENEALSYQIKFPNGEIQYADKDNIVPIPITPEILEKNGWKKLYEKFFEKNVNDIRLTIELSENFYVAINRIFIMEIHYIHELQHLLFGLGLKHEMEV